MALERIGKSLKGIVEDFGLGRKSKVDTAVQDFRELQKIADALGTETPFEPENLVEVAQVLGVFSEEEAKEYLSQ